MRVRRLTAPAEALLQRDAAAWAGSESRAIALGPAPVAMAAAVSPLLAMSQDHGAVQRVDVRLAHDGETLSVALSWPDPDRDDGREDLDRFADAVAVLFPLRGDADPLTMGDEERPVNAWLWRADRDAPFDVIARGYATSRRRDPDTSGLRVQAEHRGGHWHVVFQRPLAPLGEEQTRFEPGGATRIAFAVWEGSNAERAGQKAVSARFLDLTFDR